MTIEKIDGVWAETGDKESTLTDAKKAAGWVGGDQPEIERFNYLQNRSDLLIDKIIEERINSYWDDASDPHYMLTTGLWSDSWGITGDTANLISGGAAKEYHDLAVYFNSDKEPRILILDNANGKIEVWDTRAKTLLDTSDALTDDLPGGVTIEPMSMATDGTHVYVVVRDTNAAPDEYYVQAWEIATWGIKSGWPTTGTQLTPTGNGKMFSIIVASSTRLAIINNATTVGAAGDPVIELINISTGAIALDGAGDSPVGGVADPYVASDGTNLFFGVQNGGTLYLCSATIADPTAGTGGVGFGVDTTLTHNLEAIVAVGTRIFAFIDPASTETNTAIITMDSTAARMDEILLGDSAGSTLIDGSNIFAENFLGVTFDGVNIWLLTKVDTSAVLFTLGLMKIDASKLCFLDAVDKKRTLADITSMFYVIPELSLTVPTLAPQMGLAFDGRDIWAIAEQQSGQTYSGKIARLPLALLRS